MNYRVALAIARKDIVDGTKNLGILFSLLMPIVLSVLMNVVFPSASADDNALTVAVYDPAGSTLVARLGEQSSVRLLKVDSEESLTAEVRKKAIGGLVVVPGFDQAIQAGERPGLAVYINGRRGGGEKAAFLQLVERQLWALTGRDLPARVTVTDVTRTGQGQPLGEFRFSRYLLVLVMVMNLAGVGAYVVPTLLTEEKEKHTLEVLLLSPAGVTEVAAGKAMAGMVYSLLVAGVLIILNRGWVGNWPITLLAVLLGALFLVTLGLLTANLFQTITQVNTWSTIILLVLMAPSWFTIQSMLPPSLEVAFRAVPTFYLSEMLSLSLAGQASLARIWSHVAILCGSLVLAFAGVVWTLSHEGR
jgi:ABC-2 type transport system permease protein